MSDAERLPLRLAIYTDAWYRRGDDGVYADRALVVFFAGLAQRIQRTILLGQLDQDLPRMHYRVADSIDFVPLPAYPSLLSRAAPAAMARSLARYWRTLGQVDAVWLLGPHPLCLVFALLAAVRGRRVALGVRQDFPVYVRSRHPGKRAVHLAADLLEGAYRLLARWCPTVVVGPDIARNYASAPRLLPIYVSLVSESQLASPGEAREEAPGGQLRGLHRRPAGDGEEPPDAGRRGGAAGPTLAPDDLRRGAPGGRPAGQAARARDRGPGRSCAATCPWTGG